uniref:Fibronectin type-III domain-containing protein n=1 Tax=Poecilia latipinna TaxID=48699 RepID=A0A3B3V231_9TELE
METFQHLSSLNGYVIFLLLATISTGSACEAPSSPLCFRQDEDKNVYICSCWKIYLHLTYMVWNIATYRYWMHQTTLNHINDLSLSWESKYPSVAEVWFRKDHTESWEKVRFIAVSLQNTAYQVQIRQRSIQAANPLWSDWSPVVMVPRMPQAAAVTGVTYIVDVTQSFLRCPCNTVGGTRKKKSHNIKLNRHTVYVSYSAANITVIARNAAGLSPPAVVHVPAASAPDLKSRSYRLTCSVSVTDMKDYTRYLYFEHKCQDGKPQTRKMCLYYKKEGVPSKEPQNFMTVSDTHDSADLTWKQISYEHLRGFLTHYKLCTKIYLLVFSTKHHLKNLTPATKYNVTLAGVTQTGEGPVAMESFTTLREKPFNGIKPANSTVEKWAFA